jgi:hypothetical protein
VNGQERFAAAAGLLREKGRLRVALRGGSMRPSFAEPMVLQVGPLGNARIGDVVVFKHGEIDVAHRIVAVDADGFRTAGDAQPQVVEVVPAGCVVGRVLAVWSDGSPAARRIDGSFHRARGWYYAHFHALRRAVRDACDKASELIERARPRHRARVATRIVAGIAAVQQGDADALVAALSCDAETLARTDARHRCSALFGEAIQRFGVAERLAPDIAAHMRRARLQAVLGTSRMQRALERTIEVLRTAGIDFALLKGAARVYGAAPGAAQHASDDIDVLVHPRDVDRAVAALRNRGWAYRDTASEIRRFRAHGHHAASLFSPDGDFPVEVHFALADPGTLTLETSWDALSGHLVPLDGSAGRVLQLDAVASALHLAVHAIGLTRLRDIALLAAALRLLSERERGVLERLVQTESREAVRLNAAIALAARIAGVAWTESADVETYLRWALRREDLPQRLRVRSQAAEVYFARPRAPWAAAHMLVPWWSRGVELIALPSRVAGQCASNIAAIAYAARMEPGKSGRRP